MSKKLEFYGYSKCSTCRKAKAWLEEQGVDYIEFPIRENPPNATKIKAMIQAYEGQIKKVLNTSSQDYRASGLKDCLSGLSQEILLQRLLENGNLIKRPFLIGPKVHLVGFKPDHWERTLV